MQRNLPGAARGGPVMLRPVRVTPCHYQELVAAVWNLMYEVAEHVGAGGEIIEY